ncbi:MAG: hypothetical protein RL626_744 [Pseudomonadota bacterium]|jgi:hypothetical protein
MQMKLKTLLFLGLSVFWFSTYIFSYPRNDVPLQEPSVDFLNLKNGDIVTSPFKLVFKITGMDISPAGEFKVNSGHHHLLINQTFIEQGSTIPADQNHIHFGKGQTETELNLSPGNYKLTLQFADGYHRSYGKALSKTIQIEVK